ncbi:MAG TPA: acetyl-CoA carboxylase biotin carboxylase subunit [Nitrospiria bacterium]|nr:acetyl-CoA carboxylase biotin carboxylase subunit [Nitrospiria bacterium]
MKKPLFNKILVANRGEIALRIIRACKELKIPTVAIHSAVDATTLYVKKADEACLVGPGPIAGYLNIYRIIELAQQMGADAIHPGYGFLAENDNFARACEENGITFIGPSAETIWKMGNKIQARLTMEKAGVPIVPGILEPLETEDGAVLAARKFGFPVILKASNGGGGRGLRICHSEEEVRKQYPIIQIEAQSAFGSPEVYLEKYFNNPKHIEIQILADRFGNVIHLGERDCSIQRRHQKLIEIAPSLVLTEEMRRTMGDAAVKAARASGYLTAGTVEFLLDSKNDFYFLEMNTRIQVEHTVTEEVTGVDIVKEMIQTAAGEPLSYRQEDIHIRGFAMECRINAEDPLRNFMATPGKITSYYSPGGFGVRIDGNVYSGYTVPPYYDSLLAKLTVKGSTWEETVDRMYRSLDEYVIRGVHTTIPLYKKIMLDEKFRNGNFDVNYIQDNIARLVYGREGDRHDLVLAISAAITAHSRMKVRVVS